MTGFWPFLTLSGFHVGVGEGRRKIRLPMIAGRGSTGVIAHRVPEIVLFLTGDPVTKEHFPDLRPEEIIKAWKQIITQSFL